MKVLYLLCLLFCVSQIAFAQEKNENRIKIFINCAAEQCFEDYLITELSFFDFVRDRFQADVQILMIAQNNAASGKKYSLKFLGQKKFENQTDSAFFNTKMTDTDEEKRSVLLLAVKKGLLPFVMQTEWRNETEINFPKRSVNDLILPQDKWKNWVFTIGTEGNIEGESNRNALQAASFLSIYKVTPKNKFVCETWYEYSRNRFTLDTVVINVPVKNYGVWGYYARALTERWAIGFFGDAVTEEFTNIALQHRIAPAVEWNLYPIAENTRRQMRFGYQIGYRHQKYFETTVFDKNAETRPMQQFSVVAVYTQTWGTINGVLQARSFLDNVAQNRLSAQLSFSLRVFEGFNLTFEGSGSVINDQISLSKSSASEEEFLLRGRQLPTNFIYQTKFGCTYTFGSVNSSIVNPRFENIDY